MNKVLKDAEKMHAFTTTSCILQYNVIDLVKNCNKCLLHFNGCNKEALVIQMKQFFPTNSTQKCLHLCTKYIPYILSRHTYFNFVTYSTSL